MMMIKQLVRLGVVGLVVAGALSSDRDATADVAPQKLSWLSIGDSFSSGEGVANPEPVPTLTGQLSYPAREDRCAQAPEAWGPTAARMVGKEFTVEPLVVSACSGALIGHFYNGADGESSLWEWTKQRGLPEGGRFDLITMTFGGNDVGFADILRDCLPFYNPLDPSNLSKVPTVVPWTLFRQPLQIDVLEQLTDDCDVEYEDLTKRIDAVATDLDFDQGPPGGVDDLPAGPLSAFYKALLDRHATSRGHLVVLGYPRLFAEPPPRPLARGGEWAPWDVRCVGITPADARMINRAIEYFNEMVLEQVEQADPGQRRIHFVPVTDKWREGGNHGLCGRGEDWLNGLTTLRLGQGSFHPNKLGYAAEAELVAKLVRELPWPGSPCPKGSECLAEVSADLDGDDRQDRLGLYLTESKKFARAVLATGEFSTLELRQGAGASVGPPLEPIGVIDADADGRDDVVIRTETGGNSFYPVAILKLERNALVQVGEQREGEEPYFLVDFGLSHGAGFRCGPSGADGRPRLTVHEIGYRSATSEPDPGAWDWATRTYGWEGSRLVLEDSDTGTLTVGPDVSREDPRPAQYYGIHCEGIPPPFSSTDPGPPPPSQDAPAVKLAVDGLGAVPFGEEMDRAIAILTASLGEPDYVGEWVETNYCETDTGGGRLVVWGNLAVSFSNLPYGLPDAERAQSGQYLWGYQYGGYIYDPAGDREVPIARDLGLRTPSGIGLGSSGSDIQRVYGSRATFSSADPSEFPGPVFSVVTSDGLYLYITLDAREPQQGRAIVVQAGGGCGE